MNSVLLILFLIMVALSVFLAAYLFFQHEQRQSPSRESVDLEADSTLVIRPPKGMKISSVRFEEDEEYMRQERYESAREYAAMKKLYGEEKNGPYEILQKIMDEFVRSGYGKEVDGKTVYDFPKTLRDLGVEPPRMEGETEKGKGKEPDAAHSVSEEVNELSSPESRFSQANDSVTESDGGRARSRKQDKGDSQEEEDVTDTKARMLDAPAAEITVRECLQYIKEKDAGFADACLEYFRFPMGYEKSEQTDDMFRKLEYDSKYNGVLATLKEMSGDEAARFVNKYYRKLRQEESAEESSRPQSWEEFAENLVPRSEEDKEKGMPSMVRSMKDINET